MRVFKLATAVVVGAAVALTVWVTPAEAAQRSMGGVVSSAVGAHIVAGHTTLGQLTAMSKAECFYR